jgi:tRNA dimethylallyltransferase
MNRGEQEKTLIVVAGPTAVGKTAVAIRLARHVKAEIISADSRQFYRELNIGTAKPSREELTAVKHHFVDSHSISEDYDAAAFGEDALKIVHGLFTRSDYAVVCGGSGLYIKALLEGFDDIPEVDPLIRENLIKGYHENGLKWLQQKMKEEDPMLFERIDQQNPHRLIRALEVKLGTGSSIASFRNNVKRNHNFVIRKVGLELPREELYERIDARMDRMIDSGLFEEARSLYGYRNHNALKTVGYQEIFDHFDGLYDKDEAVRLLKRNSRRYAKRQLTWFKRDPEIRWFSPHQLETIIQWIENSDQT